MENTHVKEFGGGKVTRLTEGEWTDTHCQCFPNGDWIFFSSTRDKPKDAPKLDNGLDPGYFAVYLVRWNDRSVVVRVVGSGDKLAGRVNHRFFSPDGKSLVVVADLAAVSVDPVSLPLFVHSLRLYGDIFTVDFDPNNITKNKDVRISNASHIEDMSIPLRAGPCSQQMTRMQNGTCNSQMANPTLQHAPTHIPWEAKVGTWLATFASQKDVAEPQSFIAGLAPVFFSSSSSSRMHVLSFDAPTPTYE